MNKFEKYSFVFIGFSFFLVLMIVVLSKEESSLGPQINEDKAAQKIEQVISKTNKELESDYNTEIKKIVFDLEKVLENLSEDIADADIAYIESEDQKINTLRTQLSKTKVPKKYKSVHLLFSRSLLKLSTYLNTTNPEDMLAGVQLFEEAIDNYENLNIS